MFGNVSIVDVFNLSIFLLFTVFYAYQLYYVFVVLTRNPPEQTAKRNHKFAAVISARNENAVIGDLIHSIRVQNYPQELIDIFVIADNCTDNTAAKAQEAGAIVFPRFNSEHIGKGYALDYGFKCIREMYAEEGYEAFFIFDADNVLDVNYFREMNKVFDGGAVASTSYRNSKNYGSNWISAGYATWFLREAKFLSQARLTLGTSCAVSGTGFFVSAKIIDDMGGWKYHLLTEDIELSTNTIISGQCISYCPTAILYDEQPTTFKDAWNQRFRWAKGFYQVFLKYGLNLCKGVFNAPKGAKFACYDMLMTICPAMLISVISIIFNATVLIMAAAGMIDTSEMLTDSGASIFFCLFIYTVYMFAYGVLTTVVEWDQIHSTTRKKICYLFTFPLFMLTYIPIAIAALFQKCEWKPIQHSISVDVSDFANAAAETKATRI